MSDPAKWEAMNARYLANALKRLKLRLEHYANGEKPKPSDGRAEAAVADADGLPALQALQKALGLSHFERDLLLLCAAPEFDSSFAGLFAKAQADPARTAPTFALALSLLDDPAWEALSPERPLRSSG